MRQMECNSKLKIYKCEKVLPLRVNLNGRITLKIKLKQPDQTKHHI